MASVNTTNRNKLEILLLNIRSLRMNFDALQLKLKLDGEENKFDLICLTETWVKEHEMFKFSIPGYRCYVIERETKAGGGVVMYTRDTLRCDFTKIESTFMDGVKFVVHSGGKLPIVGLLLYRYCGGNIEGFLSDLQKECVKLPDSTFVLGDMNVDISQSSPNAHKYNGLVSAQGFLQLINEVTWSSRNATSCLDHFLVRFSGIKNQLSLDSYVRYSTEQVPFSDHYLIRITMNTDVSEELPKSAEFNFTNWRLVTEELARERWDFIDEQNVDESCGTFISKINSTIAQHTTTRRVLPRSKKRLPWVSSKLVALCDEHRKIFLSSKKHPHCEYLKAQLASLKRQIKNQSRDDKMNYYGTELNSTFVNAKKYWATLKGLTSVSKDLIKEIEIEGIRTKVEGNERKVAEEFNTYFTSIVEDLVKTHQKIPDNELKNVGTRNVDSMFCEKITEVEVLNTILDLRNTSSVGTDNISTSFLKNNVQILAGPLSAIFNKSIEEGIFPVHFKTAIVIPLFKSGEKYKLTNYRPISLLSVISKVFEKLMHKRLTDFLCKQNFFSENQYGFLPRKSVDLALTNHIAEIVKGVEKVDETIAIYCDIKKAFDSVSHEILLNKLEFLGVRGVCNDWFRSYLLNRKQKVRIGESLSEGRAVSHGVPQGSSLGPLLFLIYVNDLLKTKLNGKIFSYADDTSLVYHDSSKTKIMQNIKEDMLKVSRWFDAHQLFLNLKKTNFVTFGYKTNTSIPEGIKIHVSFSCGEQCSCPIISQSNTVRYLGVVIDPRLNWQRHVDAIIARLQFSNYQMYHLAKTIPRIHVIRAYKALYEPLLRFAISHWGSTFKIHTDNVLKMQKRVIRAIAGVPPWESSKRWFEEFDLLNVNELAFVERVSIGHRYMSTIGVVQTETSRSRASEDRPKLLLPRWMKDRSRQQGKYVVARSFNTLPQEVRQIMSFRAFRKKVVQLVKNGGISID